MARHPAKPKASTLDPNKAVSWEVLTSILGKPPYGPAGTSSRPAGGIYGESNPNSRRAAKLDAAKFKAAMGRTPSYKELAMMEARWLGWGYK
jgi:hypothetical protein